jgi:hypothetical protein
MGPRNHPCCEKNANQPTPVANVQRTHVLHPVFTAVLLVVSATDLPTLNVENHHLTLGLPPPSPPNLSSILRI